MALFSYSEAAAQENYTGENLIMSARPGFSERLKNSVLGCTDYYTSAAGRTEQQQSRGLAWALDKHMGRGTLIRVHLTTGDTLQGDYIRHIQQRVMFYMGRPQMSIPFEEIRTAYTRKNRAVIGVLSGFTVGTAIAYVLNDGIAENFYQSESEIKDGIMLFAVNSVMGGVPLGMLGGFIGKYIRRWVQIYPVQ